MAMDMTGPVAPSPSRLTAPGPLALVGSSEYQPTMLEIERELLAGRPPRFVQIPTAAARQGPEALARWARQGVEQAERLDVEPVTLIVRDRVDAQRPDLAERVRGAGLIYLSGGHPAHLVESLRDTAIWQEIVAAWRGGAALAGCSAGAMALTSRVPQVPALRRPFLPGLGLLPHLRVVPHFERVFGWAPNLITRMLLHAPPGMTVLGIEEETALIGGPHDWVVRGHQSVWTIERGRFEAHQAGAVVHTPAHSTIAGEPGGRAGRRAGRWRQRSRRVDEPGARRWR